MGLHGLLRFNRRRTDIDTVTERPKPDVVTTTTTADHHSRTQAGPVGWSDASTLSNHDHPQCTTDFR
ncbi:unnamed protein product [Heligmosomoides polygyrus]|uniref:Uncharacterized protein n=1 Tax=Heligmosomoides polygyrus TaxID=6339 RepID=A0A183F2U2_HELPZ|nr:unnamed protein product [Heligmosomoides polygyrus]